MNKRLNERLCAAGVIAVVTIDSSEDAVPLANALLSGGVSAMELTLRTDSALQAIRQIAENVPEMLIGAGTVLSARQVEDVMSAGAVFGVAPGFNRRVVIAASEAGLPFAPGVATPSEVEAAVDAGCRVLKFFPSEPIGGLRYLKAMAAPYAHLGLRYIPLGGVSETNAGDYLSNPNVLAVGGSWIAPAADIKEKSWAAISFRAEAATSLVQSVRRRGSA